MDNELSDDGDDLLSGNGNTFGSPSVMESPTRHAVVPCPQCGKEVKNNPFGDFIRNSNDMYRTTHISIDHCTTTECPYNDCQAVISLAPHVLSNGKLKYILTAKARKVEPPTFDYIRQGAIYAGWFFGGVTALTVGALWASFVAKSIKDVME